MYTTAQMLFLDAVKITKLPDTNNVVVSFLSDADGTINPAVTIGKKQLVLLLEKIARDMERRLAEATDVQSQISVCLRMSWAAKGAPVLAQRVIDFIGNQNTGG